MRYKYKIVQTLYLFLNKMRDRLCGGGNKLRKYYSEEEVYYINLVQKELIKNNFTIKKLCKDYLLFSNGEIIVMSDPQYPWIVAEVFGKEIYRFHDDIIKLDGQYTVLDLGANRCYASLYFASKSWCKDVYAFELVPQTVDFAKRNLKLNSEDLTKKIHLYNFGLGKEDCDIEIKRLENRDGCNTIKSEFIESYMPEEKGNGITQKCTLKKASSALKKIVEENNVSKIILKIDVEGAEYDIFDDLIVNYPDLFEKVEKIIGETHLGFDKFYEKIKEFNYKVVWKEQHEDGTCPFELSRNEGNLNN